MRQRFGLGTLEGAEARQAAKGENARTRDRCVPSDTEPVTMVWPYRDLDPVPLDALGQRVPETNTE